MSDRAQLNEWCERELVCPRDHLTLARTEKGLLCAKGHVYPVVQGVPVMLVDGLAPTLWVGDASLQAAYGERSFDALVPGLYIETLGISPAEQEALAGLCHTGRAQAVDPVVAYLVAATNGISYRTLVGRLHRYPIPDLRLPPGHGKRLLDIGCNWGRWTIAAANKGYDVIGVDPSLGAVLTAQRVARSLGIDARFVVADSRLLPFRADSFDVAFSYSVLQHFAQDDVIATLRQIRRVLVPTGRGMIQMAHRSGVRSLYHQARRGFRSPHGFEVRYWSFDQLRSAFERELGATGVSVDCYFGLGLQAADIELLGLRSRALVRVSELLRRISEAMPSLTRLADSLYITSTRDPVASEQPSLTTGGSAY